MKKILFCCILLIIVGCRSFSPFSAPIKNDSSPVWVNEEATKYYKSELNNTYCATKRTCVALEYSISREKSNNKMHYLMVRIKERFKIRITSISPETTEVKIKINNIEDKSYVELFYERLNKEIEIIHFDDHGLPTDSK